MQNFVRRVQARRIKLSEALSKELTSLESEFRESEA
jgi:hypothetical protein